VTVVQNAAEEASEDVCEIPLGMRRFVIPRRGDAVDGPRPLAVNAAARYVTWLDALFPGVEVFLANAQSDPVLVKEFRAAKDGLAEATPLGAAVGAALLVHQNSVKPYKDFADVIDAWIAARGLAFATAAAFELFGVAVSNGLSDNRQTATHVHRNTSLWTVHETGQSRFSLAARLRQHLVSASREDYAAARELTTAYRFGLPSRDPAAAHRRALASFLMPDKADWVGAELAVYDGNHQDELMAWLLCCSISTEKQATDFGGRVRWWTVSRDPRGLWTALDAVGSGLLPALDAWLHGYVDADGTQRVLSFIACVPTDTAFQLLLDDLDKKYYTAAVLAAAKQYPRRALRMLADAARHDSPRGNAAANVLRLHALANYELARAELANLSPAARGLVEEILAANARVPEAAADSLPAIFVNPPWLTKRTPPKPVVIAGLTAPAEAAMAWRDGEEQEWVAQRVNEYGWSNRPLDEIAEQAAKGGLHWYEVGRFVTLVPEEQVRPVLADWEPEISSAQEWGQRLVARFGVDALPPVLHLARKQPASYSYLLDPFACSEVVPLVADWLARLKSARPYAMSWLNRHPGVAARALIPTALGKVGKARSAAELTLRALAANGFAADIAEAAAVHGEAAAAAIAAMIADDGTLALPKATATLPSWADPAVLPQILLKGRQAAIPAQATEYLIVMLALSKPSEPDVGVLKAREICDPASLAGFAWALFQNWQGAEYPSKENWAFDALRWFGDDETVRRLSPLIRLWPGEGGHQRAVAGLEVLAGIGGNTALMHLYGISQKAKFKGLKQRATERIAEIAEELGLTGEQLGDRLVPDLGLDESGSLALDYGLRRFTVGFDEQLKPFAADEAGKRLKALPKPGVKDHAELAPAAYQRFSGLKKDVRTLASDQIARMELAMVAQRRWTGGEFKEFFVAHPLLRHIVRRLVWATFAEDGTVQTAFRVAEDLSFADVSEDEYALADDASVGIAHPLHLGGDLVAWAEVLADYEILQPFMQLGRPVFALTDEEKASDNLLRFSGIDMPVGKVLSLERRGWRRGAPQDAGIQGWIWRSLPDGRAVTANLNPGIAIGYVNEFGEIQQFEDVYISQNPDGGWNSRQNINSRLSSIDEVAASEILRDLTEVTAQ
jgi:hypothetical protein